MAFEGKLVKSRRKTPFGTAAGSTFAPKRLQFATQMIAGQTDVNLLSLTLPVNMPGFVNPSPVDLQSAHIYAYKNNVTLTRSDGSTIIPYLEYIIVSDTVIRLLTPASAGTILFGTIESPSSTLTAAGGEAVSSVDGFNIIATGQLSVGQTDVNVGMPFQLFANPSSQIGSVLVFRNGRLMLRNDGNITAGPSVTTGNYQEVPSGVGLTNVIRFDRPGALLSDGSLETYTVVSNGLVALAPTESVLSIIDSMGGQLDLIIRVLAAVSGQPVSFFQGSPNNIDLRVFGDRVTALENPPRSEVKVYGRNGYGSSGTDIPRFATLQYSVGTAITYLDDPVNGGAFTINEAGVYGMAYSDDLTSGSMSITVNDYQLSTNNNAIDPTRVLVGCNNGETSIAVTAFLNVGDVIRAHTNASGNAGNPAYEHFHIVKVSN